MAGFPPPDRPEGGDGGEICGMPYPDREGPSPGLEPRHAARLRVVHAGRYCARKDLMGMTVEARRAAAMNFQNSSLWYVCGRACRPRKRMYSISDGTGSRTPFIRTEGTLYHTRCPSTQVCSTCIFDMLDPRATASSAVGRSLAMADASSGEPPSRIIGPGQAVQQAR